MLVFSFSQASTSLSSSVIPAVVSDDLPEGPVADLLAIGEGVAFQPLEGIIAYDGTVTKLRYKP